ncbi:DUF3159 domain-containing protein [Streptomyces parvulus]|uniref:DUF3159 domain-containing protein n=1 Tax=Streptomyces parvulus TaxID=146923 RepID=UPI0033CFB90F
MTDRVNPQDELPGTTPDQPPPHAPHHPPRPSVLDQWGGTAGMIYMTLPVVAFVIANSLLGLGGAVVTAVGIALVITAVRLVRREPVAPALNGLTGVTVAAGISWWTGSAKNYFLLGIWLSLAATILFVGSVLVRRPLAGLVWNAIRGRDNAWRLDKTSRHYYDVATLVLAAVFAARFVVQKWLFDSDEAGWLGFAKVAMGYPLLGLALLVVVWAARRSARRLDDISETAHPPPPGRTRTPPARNRLPLPPRS